MFHFPIKLNQQIKRRGLNKVNKIIVSNVVLTLRHNTVVSADVSSAFGLDVVLTRELNENWKPIAFALKKKKNVYLTITKTYVQLITN